MAACDVRGLPPPVHRPAAVCEDGINQQAALGLRPAKSIGLRNLEGAVDLSCTVVRRGCWLHAFRHLPRLPQATLALEQVGNELVRSGPRWHGMQLANR